MDEDQPIATRLQERFVVSTRDSSSSLDLVHVGWQEWVALPELGLDRLHAKLDSGAALSSLHAEEIQSFRRGKATWVRFQLPLNVDGVVETNHFSCQQIGMRRIRSSNGHMSERPVIETMLYIAGFLWPVEITLCDRRTLEFPLLVGRNALAERCLVDCGRTHLVSKT